MGSDRPRWQVTGTTSRTIRLERAGPTYPAYGIHIQPFCEDNFVTNNDLLDAADQILFFDEGIRTDYFGREQAGDGDTGRADVLHRPLRLSAR